MVRRRTIRKGFAGRGSGWHGWVVALALVLAGVTLATSAGHEEHAADQDCAVCQLRHQAAAELSGPLQVEYRDLAAPIAPVDAVGWIVPGHFRRVSARGPPRLAPITRFVRQ